MDSSGCPIWIDPGNAFRSSSSSPVPAVSVLLYFFIRGDEDRGVRDLHQIATKLPMAGDRRAGRRGAVHGSRRLHEMRPVTPTVNNKVLHGDAKVVAKSKIGESC
ncbi:uncharacterized protein [Miscanthus floridulus]|uniref:uncharacterized protein n=1 Tax=Miscanthus floridulus TaxID=154761 RepID=UPI0034594C12